MRKPLVLVANAGDATITTFAVADDALERLSVTPLPGACSTFAVDADHELVHAFAKAATPTIVTLRLDRTRGVLTELARAEIAAPLAYLATAAQGGLLLGASYHGGVGYVWPVTDGVLGEPTAEVRFPNLHCVVAEGGYAYFVSLGADLVAQYALSNAGQLTPLDPPTIACPPGCGPRHLVLSPDARSAYLVTEFTGEAIRFDRDATGRLHCRESRPVFDTGAGLALSRFGADPRSEHLVWGADVALAGRHLLASERTAGTLASVAVDADGRLGDVVDLQPTEPQPRGFGVTGDGSRAIVAGERSTTVTLYEVAPTGRLRVLDQAETGRGANWVRVVG